MNLAPRDIDIAAHAPPIVRAEHVDPIKRVAQVFAVIPARALADPRIKNAHLRALAALGVHASALGIVYPRLERIAAVACRSRTWAFMLVRDLERWGYVRRLKSGSKRKRHAARRQIRWTKGAPIPPGEHAELDPTLRVDPWMFSAPIFQQEEAEMIRTATKEMEEPLSQDDIGRRNHEAAMRDRELLQGATRVSLHFADSVGRAAGVAPAPNFSFLTARKWLMRGFSEKECCQHIDALMAEMKGRAAWEYPYSLADWREPVR